MSQASPPLQFFRYTRDRDRGGDWAFEKLETRLFECQAGDKIALTKYADGSYYQAVAHEGESDAMLRDGKRLMDGYLKSRFVKRNIGGEDYIVTSLGNSIASFAFLDGLKRPWMIHRYVLGLSHGYLDLMCSPSISDLLCRMKASDGVQTLETMASWEYGSVNEFWFPYRGEVKDWANLMKQKFKPEFLSQLKITQNGGSLNVKGWNLNYDFDVKATGMDHIAVGFFPDVEMKIKLFQISHETKDWDKSLFIENFTAKPVKPSSDYAKTSARLKKLTVMNAPASQADVKGMASIKLKDDAELIGAYAYSESNEEAARIFNSFKIQAENLSH